MMFKLILMCIFVLCLFGYSGAEVLICDPTTEPLTAYMVDNNGVKTTVDIITNPDGSKQLKFPVTPKVGMNTYGAQAKAGDAESVWVYINYEKKPSTPIGCTIIK